MTEHWQRVEKWRARLAPWSAGRIRAIASRESFSADVPRGAQLAWTELAREAEDLVPSNTGEGALTIQEIERCLATLKHPGQVATIYGVRVEREALRFVINGAYAYDIHDAMVLLACGKGS